MAVQFKWYDREARAEVSKRATAACVAIAAYMAGEVRKEIVSQDLIDTGNLLNSIADELVAAQRAKVGTNVYYGIYLEYGTKRMSAKAFMRKAMEAGLPGAQDLAMKVMGAGI